MYLNRPVIRKWFRRTVGCLACLVLLASHNAFAVEASDGAVAAELPGSVLRSAGSATDPMSSSYMAQLVLGLIIVLLCIVALAWLAKRFNRLQSTPDGSLQVLGGMSMGARERIVLVQVGTKQLLIGVAPGHINTLHVLDEPLEAVSAGHARMPGQGFADKLSAAISRNSAGKAE